MKGFAKNVMRKEFAGPSVQVFRSAHLLLPRSWFVAMLESPQSRERRKADDRVAVAPQEFSATACFVVKSLLLTPFARNRSSGYDEPERRFVAPHGAITLTTM